MRLQDKQVGSPQILYRDTQANIEALDEVIAGAFAYATDLDKIGYYNGSDWVWISTTVPPSTLDGLSNVQIADLLSGQYLMWSGGLNKWVNITISGGAIQSLEELDNVKITSVQDGQALTWDSDTSSWINTTISGGSSINSINQTLTAAGGYPTLTAGCGYAQKTESASYDVNYFSLYFDKDTQEYAEFMGTVPDGWDGVNLTATFIWSHDSATTNFDVVWGIQMLALGNDDAIDTAYGTAQTVTDSGGTSGDVYISSPTANIVPGNTPIAGDLLQIKVFRKAADGADTLAVDARLLAIRLTWGLAA